MHFFEFEWLPDTESALSLDPPRRRPPTAIGTGELPPGPPEEPDDIDGALEDDGEPFREPSLLRRIALRLLAIQTIVFAVVVLHPFGWRAYAGVAIALVSQSLWHRGRPSSRVLPFRARHNGDGEPHLRSA